MKKVSLLLLALTVLFLPATRAAEQITASRYLIGPVSSDPGAAIRRGAIEKHPVWIIAWDKEFQRSSEGKASKVTDYNLHLFYENPEVKKMLAERFIQVFTTLDNKAIAQWIDPADQTHKPVYIVLGPDGNLIETKRHEGNPMVGTKTVQDIVARLVGLNPGPAAPQGTGVPLGK